MKSGALLCKVSYVIKDTLTWILKKITSAKKLWWYWCGSIWSLSVSRMHESAQTNDELQLGHESSAIRYCWHTHTDTHLYKRVCLCVCVWVREGERERERIWTLFSTSAAVVPSASGTSLCSFFLMSLLAVVVTFIPHLQTSVPCQSPLCLVGWPATNQI